MAQDWGADVKKYAADADDGIIAGIVRHCGIALHKADSSMVSMSDPVEKARVRDNFCKKKLGLTQSDGEIDSAIAAVEERMKGDRTKNRVTVYYLLAEQFDKLGLFAKAAPSGAGTGAAAVGVAGAAALGGTSDNDESGTAPLLATKGGARATKFTEVDLEATPAAEAAPASMALPSMKTTSPEMAPPPVAAAPAEPVATRSVMNIGKIAAGGAAALGGAAAAVASAAPSVDISETKRRDGLRDNLSSDADRTGDGLMSTGRVDDDDGTVAGGSMRWLPWLLLALGVLALLWYVLIHRPSERAEDALPVATVSAAEPTTIDNG